MHTTAVPSDANGYRTAADHDNTGWPPGVPYIVGNEACERFSFYRMKTILQVHLTTLFAVQAYVMSAANAQNAAVDAATQIVHLFVAGVYAFPMIGPLVADRWAGKYRTILYLSLIYCLGHAVLSLGNVIVAFLAGFQKLQLVDFFWIFAGLSAGAAVLFGLRAAFYQPRDFTRE